MGDDDQTYKVHGTVTGADGKEVCGADVVVSYCRIRERLQVADGKTSEEGVYQLGYRLPDDAPGKPLIVVEVRSEQLKTPLESPMTVALPDLQIDLAVALADASDYAALLRAVTPLLDKLTLLDVVETTEIHDISFLAQETGTGTEKIMRLVVSARLEKANTIPAAAFYAFLAAHVPASLPLSLLDDSQNFTLIDALVARVGGLIAGLDPDVQTRTLNAAVQNNVVGPDIAAAIPNIVARLQGQRQTNLLSGPYLAGKTSLGQLLDAAALAKDKQTLFAQALAQNTQNMEQFWAGPADGKHGFTAAEVALVRQTLSIGAFVKNTVALVTALNQRFAACTYKSMPDLATLSEQNWLELINAAGPDGVPGNITGAGGATPAATFAREIYERVTRAYPTAALASRVTGGTFVLPLSRLRCRPFSPTIPRSICVARISTSIWARRAMPLLRALRPTRGRP